jgi:RNA polymerase sigma-70 factor (ECF subfamily)
MSVSQKTVVSSGNDGKSEGREANLIAWIARGDDGAFREFYNATNGLLFGLLLRMLGHTQTAEEVLSELYEEVREKAARFGSQNERPLTWLIFIAHRRAVERLGQKRLTAQSRVSRKSINITEQRRLIRAAMNSFPYSQLQIVEMTFFSGKANVEIARELGRSPEAVEADLRHAMLQLFSLFSSLWFMPTRQSEARPEGLSMVPLKRLAD